MKVAIVGGGAAGLMAAAAIVETNHKAEVFLIDKNNGLGKKVIISGGGRCNVTTGIHDIKAVLTKYPRGGKFLNSAMHKFSPYDVYRWFEAHQVPLKVEKDLRVFPESNNGHDVVKVFENIFLNAKVKLLLNSQVMGIKKIGEGFEVLIKDESPLKVDKVVLTTGGQAFRQTGSTGDGYSLASSLGHTITDLAPSLSALFTKETWPARIAGLSFQNTRLQSTTLGPNDTSVNKHIATSGPLLFTHKGISGPAVFAFSSLIAYEKIDASRPLRISINLFPDKSEPELKQMVEVLKKANPKKSWLNVLSELVPKSMAEILCQELELDGEKKSSDIRKQDLTKCIDWLKGLPLNVVSRNAGDEFVTAGGVDLREVDPSTMQSKICPGLYFAGEILDIDGFTGGFNLQASWATGHLAGSSSVG